MAYNRTEKRIKRCSRQYGGTAQISRTDALCRECSRGEDPRGLGRWVWQMYRGNNNRRLRVVTAYRPNPSTGPFTVYAQHRALFHELNKREWEPREQMLIDLQNEINQWTGQGEQVVLMMDCNKDVRSDRMKKFLDEVGMKECILEKYGEDAPATYIDGRTPIDGIFTTWSINIK